MQRLCNNDRDYMNGAFKAEPALFAQLYSLFGILGHRKSFSDKWDSDNWDSDKWDSDKWDSDKWGRTDYLQYLD